MLLDSHTFLWLLYNPEKLGDGTKQRIEASGCFLSIVSLWELSIKFNKQKLAYSPKNLAEGYKALNLQLLSLSEGHVIASEGINLSRKDPFDTMLVAQAQTEKLPLLTADRQLINSRYKTIDASL